MQVESQKKTEREEKYKFLHLHEAQRVKLSYFLLNSRKRMRVSTCFVLFVKSLANIQL